MSLDYWANNVLECKPATLGYLMSKLKNENLGYRKEKAGDGESVLKYSSGKVVLRGRLLEGLAYKVTILPKGIIKSTIAKNYETLKEIIESSEIKLIKVSKLIKVRK